jgi:hypothetical protein
MGSQANVGGAARVTSVAPPAFDPTSWGTVVEEFDFSRTDLITESGGLVSQVNGTQGNYNVAQGTGIRQPTTGTRTAPSGLNVLDFTDDYLAVDIVNVPQPLTVAIVCSSDNPDNNNRQAWSNTATEPTIYTLTTYRFYAGGDANTTVGDDAGWHVIVGIFNGASSSLRIDEVEFTGNPGGNGQQFISIGGTVSGGFYWDGMVAHAILYQGAVADPSGLSAALNAKWAVY